MRCDKFAVEWKITLAVITFAIVQSGYLNGLTYDHLVNCIAKQHLL